MKLISDSEYTDLLAARTERDRLQALINTPELIDFPKAVLLEAAHQVERFGTKQAAGKSPEEFFWLLSHLATRALWHHKEAQRLEALGESDDSIAHHRNKAVHHCITSAAALNHWHASVLKKATDFKPGYEE